jgi:TonB-linked SusC/RagA family outer membrane protein
MRNRRYSMLCLFLFISMLFCGLTANAQTVTKQFRNASLKSVLKEVERQTNMSFLYKGDEIGSNKKITAKFEKASLRKVLDTVLGSDVTYEIQNNIVTIHKSNRPQPQQKLQGNGAAGSSKLVRGTITDANGEPVIGAAVKATGTNEATVTDADGNFQITAPVNGTLEVSYLGFTDQRIRVGGRQSISITMKEDQKQLDEVVVIGYGTTTRRSITGAVDQVKSDMLEDRPVANVTQALQGASPNLIIQRKSYNPNGENNNINIRGISTTNSNSPLIVIDGLVSGDGALNDLNPNDIENISVLKDAGAAAIYGSRSSNGVILVTTKKGHLNEGTKIRLSSSVGWEDPDILFTPVKGYQNATLKNLALTNAGMSPEFTPAEIRDLYDHQSEESWFLPQIFRTALQQSHNLSISGGSQKTTYMVSAGYYNQESNYVGNGDFGIQRYNLRSNITTEIGRFKVQALLAFTRNNSISTTGSSLEIDAERVAPYYYYKMKENGKYLLNDVLSEFNPLGSLEAGGRNKYRNNDFVANLNAEFKIIDGLKLRGVFGADVGGQHRYTRTHKVPYYYDSTQDKPSRYANEKFYTDDWNYDSYMINTQLLLDYNKTFGDHTFTGLFGVTNESYTASGNEIRVDYPNEDLGTSSSDDAVITIGGGSFVTPENSTRTSITSVLGRLGYNYQEKYYAEFNFRYDGSSKFASKNRWGFFPSLSLGWRISSEPWMKQYQERVGDMKVRGSYGVLGNQTIGTYDRYTTYNMYANTYAYNNQTVTGAGFTLGSEDLKWEKTRTLNLGFDATFLKNTLNVSFDYFYKRTVDILMKPVVPSVFGTSQSMDNLGEVSNRGWELSINYRLKTGDFVHNFTGNIGDSFNKLEKFPEKEQITSSDEIYFLKRVGVPLGSYYGYKTDGLFQSYEEIEASAVPVGVTVQPGDVKYVDRNKDGIIDSKDRFILGNAFPRYTFGFTYSVNWKGLDFSLFAQGVGKRDMMVRGELMEPFHSNYSYVIFKHQLDFWTPTNTDAKYPRLTAPGSASSANNWRLASDNYMLNGAYLRLKNITLGYTVPRVWTSKVGIEKLRVYVTGQNLLTFSHNSFIDPESSEFNNRMGSGGANSARNYPTLKYYGFGLDVEF